MIKKDNQCSGKIPYESKEVANVTAAHLNKLGGRRLNSYRCSVCHKFHVGHNSKGKKLSPHDNQKKKPIDYVHEPSIHTADKRFLK